MAADKTAQVPYLQCVPAVEDEPYTHHVNQRALIFRQACLQGLAALTAGTEEVTKYWHDTFARVIACA
jgi:hypothetical protein